MKGKNMLILNGATMCEAVQEYLDRRMVASQGKVTHVGYNASDFTFNVDLEEQTEFRK